MRLTPLPALLLQQLALLVVLGAAMWGLHALTGRTLRGLADAPAAVDLALYALVTTALVVGSLRLVARVDPRTRVRWDELFGRATILAIGFALGAGLNAIPWLLALGAGDAHVTAWRPATAGLGTVALALVLAFWNAAFEELTSRAVPHLLLRNWAPAAASVVIASLFALMHGIGESLTPSRTVYLWSLGVMLSACWLTTRRVGLGTGVHAGWFWASFIPSGRFGSGALLAVEGRVGSYVQWADLVLLVAAIGWLTWSSCCRRPRSE